MKSFLFILPVLFLHSCHPAQEKSTETPSDNQQDTLSLKSYDQVKKEVTARRKIFAANYSTANIPSRREIYSRITDYWVTLISNDLYEQWQNTPWDFNGTTNLPRQGAIACGYFVTTMLQDMDVKLNRIRLSTCASSEMMKGLTPQQPIRRLNHLSYADFNNTIKEYGKGVYVIGLDFHTGFIVNDGNENWFIHSNYIGRKGVTKELVTSSAALQSSRTRWLVSLTGDTSFLQKWLRG
jgi:hypothetical protein